MNQVERLAKKHISNSGRLSLSNYPTQKNMKLLVFLFKSS
ncbi:hypothetical protein VCRA2123O444_140055 [Vibrio crassostreae]|nr:hypothetical protein VCRA2113O411_100033 [Vibrio crassostreae]CAK1695021.1 hypothetical protein VCRA2118O429_100034 [Vibrio crassostreae]CAK1695094.1 hypothetical protein VCRA2113O412_100034 [Vibrio crassostreae]CAK1695164.1 hypothetical protein VCRA2114O421_100034 [Vibrio crassostreae]CAK1707358.1 hypothetical protein VCRA2113O414_100148 [Vibrio crassostreae]